MRYFRRTRGNDSERGSSLIEASIVLPMILLLAVGLAEVGFAVIDWLAVSNTSREGARVGSAAGKFDDGAGTTADDLIKSVVAQASCSIEHGTLLTLRVFNSDLDGNTVGNKSNTYTLNSVNCSAGTASWTTNSYTWPPSTRNNTIDNLDIVGIEVVFDHDSLTGFLPLFDATWTDTSIMRIEPDTRGTT